MTAARECPKDWCGPWRYGLCVDCGKPRRLGDPPVVPLSREWSFSFCEAEGA